ncbi:carboxypeptidase-like regulatory domain-containing protein [Cohnella mopanensis]|uniref:carboxypeptidase-like regulatory domain-containing protein n=1 Tax=Cohnella mopanensis TaxID=2911966 RepID=UPI001EF7EDF2|nr:carboxypeptidase-like regulatory domain-containing protein [Cohnella mopanensis]
MKVTLKVKHLVLSILSIGLLLSLLQFVVIPKLQVHSAEKNYEEGRIGGKKSLLAAIDNSATSGKKWELIRQYLIGNDGVTLAHSFDVYVGSGWTQSGPIDKESTIWSWEDKLPYLKSYLTEGPADQYLVSAARQLASYYMSEDEASDALAALESAEKRLTGDYLNQERALKLERAKIYAGRDEMTKAEQLLEQLDNTRNPGDLDFNGEIVQVRAQLMIRQGNVRSALDNVNTELVALQKWVTEEKAKFPDMGDFVPGKLDQLKSLKAQLEHALRQQDNGLSSTVSGVVRKSDGTPMARVGVFLRSEHDVNHSIMEGEPYQVLTDGQGRYDFKGVLPGSYQLYIGLLFEQIDGWTWPTMNDDWIDVKGNEILTENVVLRPLIEIKSPINQQVVTDSTVKFQWEPVEGAASYTLYGTWPSKSGITSALIQSHIEDDFVELPSDTLYDSVGGIYLNEVDGKIVLDPVQLLGFANPDSRFSWYVEAYDQEGRMLTRSNGYRLNETSMGALPFFYLKSRTLTAEDRLFLDGKMDEAMSAYKKAFENKPQDRHSLRMIIRIYEGQASIDREPTSSDESVAYLERMVELEPSERYVFQLFYYYYDKKMWAKVDYYYKLMAKEKGWTNSYVQSVYGTALMKQRRFEEAAVQLREAIPNDPSHRFVGHYLAVEIYSTGSLESAMRLAEQYPERAPLEKGTPNWSKLVGELELESKAAGDGYAEDMKQALDIYFDGDESRLNKWLSSTKHAAMKTFVRALETVN